MVHLLKTFVKTKTLVLVTLVALGLMLSSSLGNEALKNYLSEFIDPICCFTQNCCFMVSPPEVVDLGDNKFYIEATGETVEAKEYSKDGQYWRCACNEIGPLKWEPANMYATTRCLYVPQKGF